jgi:hypothetical protein
MQHNGRSCGQGGNISMRVHFSACLYLVALGCLVGLLFFSPSCSKSNQNAVDSTCITQIIPKVTDYQVSGADLDSIIALFRSNNLSTSNLQFQSWESFWASSPSYTGRQEQVQATQFINGLPVWSGGTFFIFNAGVFQPGISVRYTGPLPNAGMATQQTPPELRRAFLAHYSESRMEGGPAGVNPNTPPHYASYQDSCFLITLAYIDASEIPGNNSVAPGQSLVRVWKVTGLSGNIPEVMVEDDNGLAWGVVFFVP